MLLIGTLDSISTLSRSAAGCLFTSTASHNHLPPLVTTPAMHPNTTLSTTPACTDKQVQPRRRLHSPVSGRHDAHPSPSLAPLLPPKPAPDLFGCSTQSVEPSFLRNLVVDFTQALNLSMFTQFPVQSNSRQIAPVVHPRVPRGEQIVADNFGCTSYE